MSLIVGSGGGSGGVHWKTEAGAISEDVNFIMVIENDIEFTLDRAYAKPIMIDLIVEGRNPKIVTGIGITINGNTENLILTGGQGDEYVLAYDGAGTGNYILIAQGDASFTFEGLISGAVSSATVSNAGFWFGATAGQYTAVQAGTSGSGVGAEFLVTVSGNALISVDSVSSGGSGYALGDLVTLSIAGMGGFVGAPSVIQVTV